MGLSGFGCSSPTYQFRFLPFRRVKSLCSSWLESLPMHARLCTKRESGSCIRRHGQRTHGVSVISSKSAMTGGGEGREDGDGKSERRVLLPRHSHVPGYIRGDRPASFVDKSFSQKRCRAVTTNISGNVVMSRRQQRLSLFPSPSLNIHPFHTVHHGRLRGDHGNPVSPLTLPSYTLP